MKKFENRKALFNEILMEVYKFHMNYKEEINKLNINIKQIITQHSNKLQTGVAKRTLSKYSNEDPFSDKLISNSVQQMVNYFLNKYSLISEEADEIKNLIPKSNAEDDYSDKEYIKLFKQEEQKINSNLLNIDNKGFFLLLFVLLLSSSSDESLFSLFSSVFSLIFFSFIFLLNSIHLFQR